MGDSFASVAYQGEISWRLVVDKAPDAIFIADHAGRYTFVNEAACRLLGFECDEVIGKTILDFIPAHDAKRLLRSKERMLRGRSHVAEWRLRRKDGSWAPVEVHANILPGGQWQAFVRDISERKAHEAERVRAEAEIRIREQLLSAIFRLLPVGVWIADKSGRIVRNNPAGEAIWRGARYVDVARYGEYKGWWVDSGKPIGAREWALARALEKGETSTGELVRIQCFDGSFKTILNSAAPLREERGEVSGAIVVNEDVTALYRTQEQLRAAVRDREDILATVSHDLRNPLGGLMMSAAAAERMAAKLPGGEPVRALAATLMDIARRMNGMVEDLLAVAVAQSGRSMLKVAPVSARALLARAVEAARPHFEREGIGLQVEAGPLPEIHADADRILRVFGNLLDNALKFTSAGAHVVLRAEAQPGAVRYCVANTGEPLSPAELRRMFRPFWQAGREDRRGAGLGLSICRSIIEAHGGSIWAEPAQGKRVRICFLLPRITPPAPDSPAP